jgi:hypothetical protein
MAAQLASGVHVPAVQTVPLVHARPHAPQWSVAVRRSVSQPLTAMPSQSPKFVAQVVTEQVEALQAAVAVLGSMHARPQPPQCDAELRVSTSHPLAVLPSQSAKPAVQVSAQAPRAHTATALGAPLHARPHAPQWVTVMRVSVSQPLLALPSQLPKPSLHEATVQLPAMHAPVALGGAQRAPQAPQWAVLERVSVSQPLLASPSQSAKPEAQA